MQNDPSCDRAPGAGRHERPQQPAEAPRIEGSLPKPPPVEASDQQRARVLVGKYAEIFSRHFPDGKVPVVSLSDSRVGELMDVVQQMFVLAQPVLEESMSKNPGVAAFLACKREAEKQPFKGVLHFPCYELGVSLMRPGSEFIPIHVMVAGLKSGDVSNDEHFPPNVMGIPIHYTAYVRKSFPLLGGFLRPGRVMKDSAGEVEDLGWD